MKSAFGWFAGLGTIPYLRRSSSLLGAELGDSCESRRDLCDSRPCSFRRVEDNPASLLSKSASCESTSVLQTRSAEDDPRELRRVPFIESHKQHGATTRTANSVSRKIHDGTSIIGQTTCELRSG